MLNDLVTIERGMAAYGIDLVDRHSDIKDMAKGSALRARLDARGSVASIEIVVEAGRGALWTLRDGQHNGFPGLKTVAGLLSLDAAARRTHDRAWEEKRTPAARRTELLRLIADSPVDAVQSSSWPNAGHRRRIAERLETLRTLSDDTLTAAVPAVFERFLLALETSPGFLAALIAALAERLRSRGDEWIDPVRAALIGPIALAIDVAENEFPRDACDSRQVGPVSATLDVGDGSEIRAPSHSVCALSGKSAKLHTGRFPQPNLPGLGQTYLFSRNKDIPSLARYGRLADPSFPIDSALVRRLSGAITRLTQDDAKGHSWCLIPPETGDKRDLLVISSADPTARLADAMALERDDDDEFASPQSAWGETGANVVKQTHGIYKQAAAQDDVIILVLRTVDPANGKAIYHRNTTSALIHEAAQLWSEAAANIPTWLAFPAPGKGKSELAFWRPPSLEPLSIISLSRVQFANGGIRRVPVIGVTAGDAFGLFLREGDFKTRAGKILRLLLLRHSGLLSALASRRVKGIDQLREIDPKTDLRRDALRSVTWIGALLYHLGRSKEAYMSDAAFRLGQLLAAADLIHVGYCADLRGGDVPPTLLGNSVLTTASGNPIKALSVLCVRLKPYLAWAKRADAIREKASKQEQRGNKSNAFALRQGVAQAYRAREIAADLHAMLAPYRQAQKTDDVFKAELLLGYLAGVPPRKTSDVTSSGSADIEENQEQGAEEE